MVIWLHCYPKRDYYLGSNVHVLWLQYMDTVVEQRRVNTCNTCGFSHSTLACYAVTSWPPCHSTWVHVTVHGHLVTIHGPISLACYAHVKNMCCDMGHMTCDMSPCDMGDIYFDSVCTMILCMYCDSGAISAHVL